MPRKSSISGFEKTVREKNSLASTLSQIVGTDYSSKDAESSLTSKINLDRFEKIDYFFPEENI